MRKFAMADRQGTKIWLAKEHGTLTYAASQHWTLAFVRYAKTREQSMFRLISILHEAGQHR